MEEEEEFTRKLFFLLLTITIIFSLFHLSAAEGDATVMADLAKSLSPKPSGWSGSNHCKWSGIACDSSGRVTSINLASKFLSGELPPNLNQLSRLKSLSLQKNSFSGPLPSLANLTSLEEVSLNSNNFSSVPPSFLVGLTSLQTISISENPNLPPWTIPKTLAESTTLNSLLASKSNVAGPMPDIFGSFPNLKNVRLSYNNLTGSLPPSFAKSGIQNLWLNNQLIGLSGRIDVLGTMSQLIQNNKLQGPYPDFRKGIDVTLGNSNSFCNASPGPCDPQVTTLLEVARALGYPMALAESWEGNNPCQGWNFISCDSEGSVTLINFGKQHWGGMISPAIANLTALKTLLLNDNNLNGSIPASLMSLAHLQLLDVSNNNLSGKVPTFASSVSVKISVLSTVIYNRFVKKRSGNYKSVKSFSGRKEKVKKEVGGVSDYGGIVSEPHSQSSGNSSDIQVYDGGNVDISIEVLREVTNNFSEDNILGQGGFGVVYRGKLHDGTQIAVKRMESAVMSSKGLNEFQAEIAVLTKVRHRHLVALHGYCVNGNERLLVYEYMSQGTLGQHLFEYNELGFPPLTWKQRVTIALDVARGVEYLHSLAQQSFIHRDLKSSNILLGDDMRAKVSDFGLVKNAPDGKYSVETRLAGTFGYLAPEYASTGRVTTKVDVFSFGVIVMEMITGKKALDDTLPEEKSHLVTWFRKVLNSKDSIRNSLDPSLNPDEETFESICKVAELAGYCTARESFQRPDMGHAVNVLSPLVEQWKPVSNDEDDSFGIELQMSLPCALQRMASS
ncbi:hypothetical protein F0562_021704 [Nyssa sinensis]|uniref:Protein kinase domain-containing protein n=1 Tax=Nyssa sinensis TaxID=561372 RepID=A0A5J5BN33_9ASTE|nr:hypothetical protein F0562_021704 [Nyssa sinensis]